MADSTVPSPPPESDAPPVDRIKQLQSLKPTGNIWTDAKLAWQSISLRDDLSHVGEMPCARKSFLTGIMSGAGVGFVRGWSTRKILVGCNWAVGTFCLVSIGMWEVCQSAVARERATVQVAMQKMAERRVRRQGAPDDTSPST